MMKKCYIRAVSSIAPDGTVSEDGAMHAIEPEYGGIITNPNLRRRMSRFIKMGVACGLRCLNENNEQQVDAIITATGLGGLADTEKFLTNLIECDEQMLNPTAFIRSTFNTVGSQIALMIDCRAYNNTFVHRTLSFESALIDGLMKINEGNRCLLIGAVDELIPAGLKIINRLGFPKEIKYGEGANFFVLGSEATSNNCAELRGLKTFAGNLDTNGIEKQIKNFLSEHLIETKDIHVFMTGKNGNRRQDAIYDALGEGAFATSHKLTFKDVCGEYFTASSYAVWKAACYLKEQQGGDKQHLLIYNHFNNIDHALILLASC